MELEQYFKDGFVLSPYYNKNDAKKYEKVKTKVLSKDDIRAIVIGTAEERSNILYSKDELILVKYSCRYHVTPQDLIERFEKELNSDYSVEYDDIISWSHFSAVSDNDGPIFTPHLDEKYYEKDKDGIEDYLFKKDDHIVSFVVRLVRTQLRSDKVREDLLSYVKFIKDVLSKKEYREEKSVFEVETYSLMVDSLCYEVYMGRQLPQKIEDFYRTHLSINAEHGDNRSMRTLGYEYYEGTNGFPLDQKKSLYWLEKYFNATGDPDVARTIGYIYYYGRTTNGIPQGDKAFQYFAIGHIAGHYYEATYKLADCYLKGYGTPVCHQAAYNLVRGIYDETMDNFLRGDDSKFADVALRLGNYYKDGIYVDKNLCEAQLYLLEAKAAIKKRLEHMEYVGDRSVAMAISNNLEEVEKELKVNERIIKDDGYIANKPEVGFKNQKFEVVFKDNEINIVIRRRKSDDKKYFINYVPSINFVERSEKVVFKVIPVDPESAKEFVESVNDRLIKGIGFFDDKVYVLLDMGKGEEFPAFTTYTDLIFYPQTLKNISKKYAIASVEFYPGSKLYDYLCLDGNIKEGDVKTIVSRGERKQVRIKSIKYLYEDQLPLPFDKMAKL